MDINSVPSGSRLLVDANIIIYYFAGASPGCKTFFTRIANRELGAFVTTTIVAEVLHRRMVGEAIARGLISSGQPLKKLKANPKVIIQLKDYITEVEKLLRLPIPVQEVVLADIAASHALRGAYGLFVNDSINLACAQRIGITDIATLDADFSRVPSITVWEPSDI